MTDDRTERLEEALQRIAQWSDAYPLAGFPEPNEAYYQRAHDALTEAGLSLDRLTAAAIRHVIAQVGKIAKDALDGE
jgi:parvulin-like peptidyl-prolyl isomerase